MTEWERAQRIYRLNHLQCLREITAREKKGQTQKHCGQFQFQSEYCDNGFGSRSLARFHSRFTSHEPYTHIYIFFLLLFLLLFPFLCSCSFPSIFILFALKLNFMPSTKANNKNGYEMGTTANVWQWISLAENHFSYLIVSACIGGLKGKAKALSIRSRPPSIQRLSVWGKCYSD